MSAQGQFVRSCRRARLQKSMLDEYAHCIAAAIVPLKGYEWNDTEGLNAVLFLN